MTAEVYMRLRLQLLSYDLSPNALEMLRICEFEGARHRRISVRLFPHNPAHRTSVESIQRLDSRLRGLRFNAVALSSSDSAIGDLNAKLEVSPNSPLWEDARVRTSGGTNEELQRIGFESLQLWVAARGIKNYPTTLDCIVARPPLSEGEDLYLQALSWLKASWETARMRADVCGACDVLHNVSGEAWSSMANELELTSEARDNYAGKFDRLHDILICRPLVGDRLAELLGPEVIVSRMGSDSYSTTFIAVPPDKEWRQHAEMRASQYFAPRRAHEDSSTFSAPYPVHSAREYRQLDDAGVLPRLSWDWIVHPVIGNDHREILGIAEEEIIVLPMHRMTAARIQEEIVRAWNKGDMTRSNLLEEYEKTYSKYFNPEYMHRVFERLKGLVRSDIPSS